MVDDGNSNKPIPTYSGEKARQGTIILRTRLQRTIFVAGLVGLIALAAMFAVFAWDARETAHASLDREMPALTQRGDVTAD